MARGRSASVLVSQQSWHGPQFGRASLLQGGGRKNREAAQAESDFFEAVHNSEAYVRLQRDYQNDARLSDVDMDELLSKVCKACWQEVEKKLQEPRSHLIAHEAQVEIESLKKQLVQCNLQAVKQINAMKSTVQHGEQEMDEIMFFEPLKFLEKAERDLVLGIALEKVQQIEGGTAPGSLIEMLKEYITETGAQRLLKPRTEDADDNADFQESAEVVYEKLTEEKQRTAIAKDMLKSSEARLATATERLEQAETDLSESEELLEQVRQEVVAKDAEIESKTQRLAEVTEQLAVAEAACEQAQARVEDVQKQLADAQTDFEVKEELWSDKHEASIESPSKTKENSPPVEQQGPRRTSSDAAAISKAMARIDTLQAEKEALTRDLKATKGELQSLQAEHAELQAQVQEVRATAVQPPQQKEQAERPPQPQRLVKEVATQTLEWKQESLPASDGGEGLAAKEQEVQNLTKENQKLKVMLEELKAKLSELMSEFRSHGLMSAEIEKICEEVGLKPLLKAPSIFVRLYQDALDRVSRMERLREKYRGVSVISSDGPAARKHVTKDMKRPRDISPGRGPRDISPGRANSIGFRRESVDVLTAVEHSDLIDVLAPDTPKVSSSAVGSFDTFASPGSSPQQAVLLRGQTLSIDSPGTDRSSRVGAPSPDASRRRPCAGPGATPEPPDFAEHSAFLRGGSHAASAYPDRPLQTRFPSHWINTAAARPPLPPPVPAASSVPATLTLSVPAGLNQQDDGQTQGGPRLLQHSRMTTIPVPTHDGRLLQAPPVVTWVLEKPQPQLHHPPPPGGSCLRSRLDAPMEGMDPPLMRRQDVTEGDINPVAAHMRNLSQSEPTLPVIDRGTQMGTVIERTQVGRFPGFTPCNRLDASRSSSWR